ncbi:DUF4870 domain-containing protein [Leptolyngbya sp. PL-A3]|nr:DUF4870 domain-containing protein [Leptolyngbya sp. FACHB-8]
MCYASLTAIAPPGKTAEYRRSPFRITNMEDPNNRKALSVLCHAAVFLSSTIIAISIPIIVLYVSNDPVVKENAKESLNFHINLYAYAILFFVLILFVIGIPLLVLLGVASIVMPIIAIVKVLERPDIPYRYPFIFRLF